MERSVECTTVRRERALRERLRFIELENPRDVRRPSQRFSIKSWRVVVGVPFIIVFDYVPRDVVLWLGPGMVVEMVPSLFCILFTKNELRESTHPPYTLSRTVGCESCPVSSKCASQMSKPCRIKKSDQRETAPFSSTSHKKDTLSRTKTIEVVSDIETERRRTETDTDEPNRQRARFSRGRGLPYRTTRDQQQIPRPTPRTTTEIKSVRLSSIRDLCTS
eukprot:scaffold6695_cov155-Amphora_coffeaeformis.AAC.2